MIATEYPWMFITGMLFLGWLVPEIGAIVSDSHRNVTVGVNVLFAVALGLIAAALVY